MIPLIQKTSWFVVLSHPQTSNFNTKIEHGDEHEQLTARLGNKYVNDVLEANVTEGYIKPMPNATPEERASWIRAKYVDRLFVRPTKRSPEEITKRLYKACHKDKVKIMLDCFAHGANIDARFPPHDEFVPPFKNSNTTITMNELV